MYFCTLENQKKNNSCFCSTLEKEAHGAFLKPKKGSLMLVWGNESWVKMRIPFMAFPIFFVVKPSKMGQGNEVRRRETHSQPTEQTFQDHPKGRRRVQQQSTRLYGSPKASARCVSGAPSRLRRHSLFDAIWY